MLEFLRTPLAQAVLWFSILTALIAIGVYVVAKFRDRAVGSESETGDMLTSFREMRQQGDLSETEFRTIKTMLGGTPSNKVTERGNDGCEQSG